MADQATPAMTFPVRCCEEAVIVIFVTVVTPPSRTFGWLARVETERLKAKAFRICSDNRCVKSRQRRCDVSLSIAFVRSEPEIAESGFSQTAKRHCDVTYYT